MEKYLSPSEIFVGIFAGIFAIIGTLITAIWLIRGDIAENAVAIAEVRGSVAANTAAIAEIRNDIAEMRGALISHISGHYHTPIIAQQNQTDVAE